MVVVMTLMMVIVFIALLRVMIILAPITIIPRRFRTHFSAERLQEFFQFATIEPYAAALRTNVYFDSGSIGLSHSHVAIWAGEQGHFRLHQNIALRCKGACHACNGRGRHDENIKPVTPA